MCLGLFRLKAEDGESEKQVPLGTLLYHVAPFGPFLKQLFCSQGEIGAEPGHDIVLVKPIFLVSQLFKKPHPAYSDAWSAY